MAGTRRASHWALAAGTSTDADIWIAGAARAAEQRWSRVPADGGARAPRAPPPDCCPRRWDAAGALALALLARRRWHGRTLEAALRSAPASLPRGGGRGRRAAPRRPQAPRRGARRRARLRRSPPRGDRPRADRAAPDVRGGGRDRTIAWCARRAARGRRCGRWRASRSSARSAASWPAPSCCATRAPRDGARRARRDRSPPARPARRRARRPAENGPAHAPRRRGAVAAGSPRSRPRARQSGRAAGPRPALLAGRSRSSTFPSSATRCGAIFSNLLRNAQAAVDGAARGARRHPRRSRARRDRTPGGSRCWSATRPPRR